MSDEKSQVSANREKVTQEKRKARSLLQEVGVGVKKKKRERELLKV